MSRPKTVDRDLPYQSIRCAAEITGLSRKYIYEGCKNGTIVHRKVGTDYRVYMPALLAPPSMPCTVPSQHLGGDAGEVDAAGR